jgi:hypothetical protein
MSSAQSSNVAIEKVEDDHKAKWYPWHGTEGPLSHHGNNQVIGAEYFHNAMERQRLEYESKHLSLKNELISTRGELLTLREVVSTMRGEMSKLRPLIDERKRNSLLRKREPFPFTPEHTKQANDSPSTSAH